MAVRHARKREQWGFFLALLNKDLVVKQRSSVDIVFLDGATDITWLENSSSDDIFFFREGNRDTHNSPYTVIDKVDIGLGVDDQGRFYIICQADVDRLKRQLKGGLDSDVASLQNHPMMKKTVSPRHSNQEFLLQLEVVA